MKIKKKYKEQLKSDFKALRTNKGLYSKKSIISILLIFLLFYFSTTISLFIGNNFVLNNPIDNIFIDILVLFATFIIVYYQVYKIKIEYTPSYYQLFTILLIFISYINFRLVNIPDNWEFTTFSISWINDFKHLDPIVCCLLPFPIVYLFKFIKKRYWKIKPETPDNILIEDLPIDIHDDDFLDQKDLLKEITNILINDKYDKSFSIGLIGPWGNGKSSVINLVKKEIEENENKKGVITIDFSPFLNHNEEDIISDFFNLLSDNLKEFHGGLAKQIHQYSDSLINLYKKGESKSLFEQHIFFSNKTPAQKLYTSINNKLKEIGKKLIIFVDDLDRLNDKEILQVLKLIRNTADFANTTFIVAMDKDYVVKTIKEKNESDNTRFIEKFFQLEIFLPEIDNKLLRKYFEKLISEPNKFKIEEQELIIEALNSESVLFNDYIKNIRAVKRLVNQLIFDNNFFNGDIDFNDFLNFIFLKIHYPKIIQILYEKRDKYFDIWTFVELKKIETEEVDLQNKYVIEDIFKNNEDDCNNIVLDIDCQEQTLLLKTLTYLFGKKDNDFEYPEYSIQQNRIFYKMLALRYSKDDIEEDFLFDLFGKVKNENKTDLLKELVNSNNLNKLIERLFVHKPKSIDGLTSSIIILLNIYDKIEDSNIRESITKALNSFYKEYDKDEYGFEFSTIEIKEILIQEFFNRTDINLIRQINLLNYINYDGKDSFFDDNLIDWGFTINEMEQFALNYFERYIKDKVEFDYSFYQFYYDTSSIGTIKNEINNTLIQHLKEIDISSFCAIALEKHLSDKLFKINDKVDDIFGTRSDYVSFVKNHQYAEKNNIKEYLDFLELSMIFRRDTFINYYFKEFKPINYPPSNETDTLFQYILEIKSEYANFLNDKLQDVKSIWGKLESKHYLMIKIRETDSISTKSRFTEIIKEIKHKIKAYYLIKNNIGQGTNPKPMPIIKIGTVNVSEPLIMVNNKPAVILKSVQPRLESI